jgi:hypothetical protein
MAKHKPTAKFPYRERKAASILYPDQDGSPDENNFLQAPEIDLDRPGALDQRWAERMLEKGEFDPVSRSMKWAWNNHLVGRAEVVNLLHRVEARNPDQGKRIKNQFMAQITPSDVSHLEEQLTARKDWEEGRPKGPEVKAGFHDKLKRP